MQVSNEVLGLGDAIVGAITAGEPVQIALANLRASNHGTSAAATFWWTEGGADFPPMALASRGFPDPFCYSTMLTGKIPVQADSCA